MTELAANEPVPALSAAPVLERLWTIKEAAAFLRKSERWLWYALKRPPDEPGSVPHVKLGKSPRFMQDDLKAWAAAGFPPAGTFKTWKESEERRRRPDKGRFCQSPLPY